MLASVVGFVHGRRLASIHDRSIPDGATSRVVRSFLNITPGDKVLYLSIDGFPGETDFFADFDLFDAAPTGLVGVSTDFTEDPEVSDIRSRFASEIPWYDRITWPSHNAKNLSLFRHEASFGKAAAFPSQTSDPVLNSAPN
jgi:hypothetical protein